MKYTVVAVKNSVINSIDLSRALASSGIKKCVSKKHTYFIREGELAPLLCEILSRLHIQREEVLAVNQQTTDRIIEATHKSKTRSNTVDLGSEFEENKPKESSEKVEPEKVASQVKPEVESEKVKPEIVASPVFVEEPKFVPNMGEQKFKTEFQVPLLKTDNADQIENFTFAMRFADGLNAMPTTNLLYQVLVKSNREDLLKTLSAEQLGCVEKFCEFIKEAYGDSSGSETWQRLGRICQGANESELIYYQRLLSIYYATRGKSIPAKIPDEDRNEITFRFISGLREPEVRRIMTQQKSEIAFEKLAKTAKNYRESGKMASVSVNEVTQSMSVLAVDRATERSYGRRERRSGRYDQRGERGRDRDMRRSRSRERFHGRGYSRDRTRSRSFGRSRERYEKSRGKNDRSSESSESSDDERRGSFEGDSDKRCFRCGTRGHYIKDCLASDKTVSRYHRLREARKYR